MAQFTIAEIMKEEIMIISNLEHLEAVSEENAIQGARAAGDAFAFADADGVDKALSLTATDTNAFADVGERSSFASSESSSSAI